MISENISSRGQIKNKDTTPFLSDSAKGINPVHYESLPSTGLLKGMHMLCSPQDGVQ